jgi:hydroxymethylglutaryl-CoA lyase
MSGILEICEVAPRDGLQSAATILSAAERVAFIARLVESGLTKIEVGSLVNPKLVPTMADSDAVFTGIGAQFPQWKESFSLLVPNRRGLDRAKEIGCTSVALFSATSETFNKKNINRGVAESILELEGLIADARKSRMHIRLYVSTVFDCAYQGTMQPIQDLKAFLPLFEKVDEVSLGDTTGRATVAQITELLDSEILKPFNDKLWWHFHDTFQLAGENTRFCIEQGFRKFDSSAGGIGGCPFSPGAKGNIATEKVIAIAEEMGLKHNIDPGKLAALPMN